MKLVTYDDGQGVRPRAKVGYLDGEEIVRLEVPTMRAWFERGGADETGERTPLAEARLRAPIVPKKFFHTAGNFREHEEESKNVNWTHRIAPWINFFQNVDAIVGPDEPIVYPEHLTEELDYELELAVVIKKAGKWFSPEEAADYIGGYVIFNDITARDIQRGEMRSGVFSFCKAIDTFCPLGPWIVTPDEIPDPHDLAMELRVNGEPRQESHSSRMSVTIPEILSNFSALGYSAGDVLSTGTVAGVAGFKSEEERRRALPQARRRRRGRDRADRRVAQPGRLLAGGPRRAAAAAHPSLGRGRLGASRSRTGSRLRDSHARSTHTPADAPDGHRMRPPVGSRGGDPVVARPFEALRRPAPRQHPLAALRDAVALERRATTAWLHAAEPT